MYLYHMIPQPTRETRFKAALQDGSIEVAKHRNLTAVFDDTVLASRVTLE